MGSIKIQNVRQDAECAKLPLIKISKKQSINFFTSHERQKVSFSEDDRILTSQFLDVFMDFASLFGKF